MQQTACRAHLLSIFVEFLHHARLANALVLTHVDEHLHSCVKQLRLDYETRPRGYLRGEERAHADRDIVAETAASGNTVAVVY